MRTREPNQESILPVCVRVSWFVCWLHRIRYRRTIGLAMQQKLYTRAAEGYERIEGARIANISLVNWKFELEHNGT